VLAMTLFPGLGYLRVWDKLTAALEGLGLSRPPGKALRGLRRRIEAAPVKAPSETIAVPLAPPQAPGGGLPGDADGRVRRPQPGHRAR
jgi:hypothetical protein